ncbi:MAG: esterase-like activity of phytase family protein [Myxococcota bacterium]
MQKKRTSTTALMFVSLIGLALWSDSAHATGFGVFKRSFRRIATFPVFVNNADIADETVAEIVDVTPDGRTLVYTDSELEALGLIDIRWPWNPQPLGTIPLGGEPTSVSIRGRFALAAVVGPNNTFTEPEGFLQVVDLDSQSIVRTLELAGQPDSVKVSPDGRFCAVAIENERDEDIIVDGVEGGLPQPPPGLLQIIDLVGPPASWSIRSVSLTGLAGFAPEDPEPEFVDINHRNEAVITLQENNAAVIVKLRTGRVRRAFGLGTVDLNGVDATEDGIISLTENLTDVPREPDAVAWIDNRRFATANEGDLFGGSRGFSIFDRFGRLLFDSGTSLEELAVRHGHYPEERSENKGTEPEGIAFGRFGRNDLLFVGSERGGFVAVYDILGFGPPRFRQFLPTGLEPEGVLPIPSRNLLVVSAEEDDPTFGVRTTVMIYRFGILPETYPQILSENDGNNSPIPWSALSGMTSVPHSDELLAVWDSFYSESRIFSIDPTRSPARVTDSIVIQGGSGNFDPEGITIAPDGTRWIASEGNASGSRRNRLLQLDAEANVVEEVFLPDEIEACRADSTNRGSLGAGFEGVAAVPSHTCDIGYELFVAQQRGWDYTTPECEDLDDDPTGANAGEPPNTRIWRYCPTTSTFDFIAYELDDVPANASWIGLSEVSLLPDGTFMLIERDNRTGDFAEVKNLVRVDLSGDGADGIQRSEKERFDVIPALSATNGWITDKPEGTAVTSDGRVFLVTDNDGVDGWSGETWFLRLGRLSRVFPSYRRD